MEPAAKTPRRKATTVHLRPGVVERIRAVLGNGSISSFIADAVDAALAETAREAGVVTAAGASGSGDEREAR